MTNDDMQSIIKSQHDTIIELQKLADGLIQEHAADVGEYERIMALQARDIITLRLQAEMDKITNKVDTYAIQDATCKAIGAAFGITPILMVCSWCGAISGAKDGEGTTGVSHGICPACAKKEMEGIR